MTYWERVEEERRRKELEKLKYFKPIPKAKDEFEETEELMRKEREAKEKAEAEREELCRRYAKFIMDSIFDENKAGSDYAEASRMAEALGLPVQAEVLRKIAADEARHSAALQGIAQYFKLKSR